MRSESASVPTGSVPGMRLASAQKAFLAFPGGKRKGAVTNPGRKSSSGRKARLATSNPAMTEPRKKLTASAASAPSRSHDPSAGRSARLVQVAPAAPMSPTGRSDAVQPEIASQKAKKRAARDAAALARREDPSPSRALKDEVRRRSQPQFPTCRHVSPPALGHWSATTAAEHRGAPLHSNACRTLDRHEQLPYPSFSANADRRQSAKRHRRGAGRPVPGAGIRSGDEDLQRARCKRPNAIAASNGSPVKGLSWNITCPTPHRLMSTKRRMGEDAQSASHCS